MTIANSEIIDIAKHSSQSIEAVVRVYSGGATARIRERVKASADILAYPPPPERDGDPETTELNFDN